MKHALKSSVQDNSLNYPTPFRPLALFAFIAILFTAADAVASPFFNPFAEMRYLFRDIVNLFLHPPEPVRYFFGAIGVGCLLFGSLFYKIAVMLPGMAIGGLLGFGIGIASGGGFWGAVGVILGAGLGGTLAWWCHQILIWLLGAFISALAVTGISAGVFHSEPNGIVVIIAAILGGSLLLALSEALIIFKSSLLGAFLLTIALQKLDDKFYLLGFLVVGVLFQYGALRIFNLFPPIGKKEQAVGAGSLEAHREIAARDWSALASAPHATKGNPLICPWCGGRNERSSKFCTSCGADLKSAKPNFCTGCGSRISDLENSFCTNCGMEVS